MTETAMFMNKCTHDFDIRPDLVGKCKKCGIIILFEADRKTIAKVLLPDPESIKYSKQKRAWIQSLMPYLKKDIIEYGVMYVNEFWGLNDMITYKIVKDEHLIPARRGKPGKEKKKEPGEQSIMRKDETASPMPVSVKPAHQEKEKHASIYDFTEAERKKIGQEAKKYGVKETAAKYNLSIYTVLAVMPRHFAKTSLPPFPVFDDSWPAEVIKSWFEAYAKIHENEIRYSKGLVSDEPVPESN